MFRLEVLKEVEMIHRKRDLNLSNLILEESESLKENSRVLIQPTHFSRKS